MCRMFAFHSVTTGHRHRSLLAAENALVVQSEEHPDGWGIAYYQQGAPHVIKGLKRASEDQVFRKLGQLLGTDTVIAHLRRATQGEISLVNCHPFRYGNWIMAHNGDLPAFQSLRQDLLAGVDPEFLSYVLGTTDSEIYFVLYLTELLKMGILGEKTPPIRQCAVALRNVVDRILFIYQRNQINEPPALNVTISNGRFLLGYRNGHELSFSAHKGTCADSEACAHADHACLNSVHEEGVKVSHLLISSEPIASDNIWQSLDEGQIVAVDHEFRLFRSL